MIEMSARTGFKEEHAIFRESVRRFFEAELVPAIPSFEEAGTTDRAFWKKAGRAGLLCPQVPEAFGGPGLDFRFNAIVAEELGYCGSPVAFGVHSDITPDYFLKHGSETLKREWLPGMVSGELISAIVMTEPSTGSDLARIRTTARQDGDRFILNGSKTYISNGQNADVGIVAVRTGGEGARGISLLAVDLNAAGVVRGRNLDKIGQSSADTSELFFEDVNVPAGNLIGELGQGFAIMMQQLPQERLSIALSSQGYAQRALDEALAFTKERSAFGTPLFELQNTRFELAKCAAQLQVGWAHLDWAIARLIAGSLTAAQASAAKLWHSETQWSVVDAALQMHGGAGYMSEYTIARLWRDSRVMRIYGGTSEIMKEVIARDL